MYGVYLQDCPERIIPSMVATKSVSAASTASIPARTDMMSELGCAYFFDSTHEKKTLRVCPLVSAASPPSQKGAPEPRERARPRHCGHS